MLFLQEIDLEIRDKKEVENQVIDHLSRHPEDVGGDNHGEIKKYFPDEQLLALKAVKKNIVTGAVIGVVTNVIIVIDAPRYADVVNYLVSRIVPADFNFQQRRIFTQQAKEYY